MHFPLLENTYKLMVQRMKLLDLEKEMSIPRVPHLTPQKYLKEEAKYKMNVYVLAYPIVRNYSWLFDH